jgi:transmembrane sensor
MQSQKIANLLDRYIRGELTEEERQELTHVLADPAQAAFVEGELARLMERESGDEVGEDVKAAGVVAGDWEPVLQRVLSVDRGAGRAGEMDGGDAAGGGHVARGGDAAWGGNAAGRGVLRSLRYGWRRWSAVAILLLLAGGGVLLFLRGREAGPVVTVAAKPPVRIQPGTNRAVLTLGNGQQIILNNAKNGTIGQQGNIRVIKLDNGELAYSTAAGASPADRLAGSPADKLAASPADQLARGPLYNTITTPRGGQYQVTLADGTKVWLNAESSLRFPTAFAGKERRVELRGEAYFEVKADKDKPFLVKAGETETRVLGTNFNIMAYSDEGAVKTTLLEGAVSMGKGMQSAMLRPGEQGQYDNARGVIGTRAVNTRAVVAWKDGYYFFDRTPMKNVMRQIARWYDVTIVYQGAAPEDEIVGKLPRTADVKEVLHIMELIGIHFKIEGKTIVVQGS